MYEDACQEAVMRPLPPAPRKRLWTLSGWRIDPAVRTVLAIDMVSDWERYGRPWVVRWAGTLGPVGLSTLVLVGFAAGFLVSSLLAWGAVFLPKEGHDDVCGN